MSKTKKFVIVFICIAALSLTAIGYSRFSPARAPKEIVYLHGDTNVNLDDPREVIGAKSYAFVGLVEDTYDYYSTKKTRNYPQVIHDNGMSFTECVVTVVKNIKGELEENQTFSFYKVGGITEDGKSIELYENDLIPEKGKYYIFTGIAHKDGTITGGGRNGTIELEEQISSTTLSNSEIYNSYVQAYKNQIIDNTVNRIQYVGKNDIRYNNGEYNANLFEKEEKQ